MNCKIRNSNVELLRIIAMLFIVSHHYMVHGMHIWQDISWGNFALLSLNSACYISVNAFVLISGYCGIRFDLKKLLHLYLLTAIVGGLGYITHLFVDNASLGRSIIYNTLLVFSNPPKVWFIRVYVFLFLLSPLLNTALANFTKKQMHLSLILLTIICVYFGWFWQNDVNKSGDNLMNFIWIYTIGYYLRNYFEIRKIKPICYLFIWCIASILNVVLAILFESYIAWTHNNPLVVLAAIAFFLFFVSYDFSSKWINLVASSTLGVYLIHENVYLSRFLYKDDVVAFYSSNIICFICSVFVLYVICSIIDYIIRKFVVNPLLNFKWKANI